MAGVPGTSLPQGCFMSPPHTDPEVWVTCAGPLLRVPPALSIAAYFPQGHAEHVSSVEIAREVAEATKHSHQMLCHVMEVTAQADVLSEELSIKFKLKPVGDQEDARIGATWERAHAELTSDSEWPPRVWGHPEAVWKVLSPSDASPQGGLTLPERAANTCFPPLDMEESLPFQSISAKDLFDRTFTFKHVYRGRPRRNKLTTNWNAFMQEKQLQHNDRIVFIRGQGGEVKVGVRRGRAPLGNTTALGTPEEQRVNARWILQQSAACQAQNLPFEVEFQVREGASPFVIPLDQLCNSLKQLGEVRPGRRFRMPRENQDFRVELVAGTVQPGRYLEQAVRAGQSQTLSFSALPPLWRLLQVQWADQEAEQADPSRPASVSPWQIMLLELRRGQVARRAGGEAQERRTTLGRRRRGSQASIQVTNGSFQENTRATLERLSEHRRELVLGRVAGRSLPGGGEGSPETMRRVVSHSHSYSRPPSPLSPASCPERVGQWEGEGDDSVHGGTGAGAYTLMEQRSSVRFPPEQHSRQEYAPGARHVSIDLTWDWRQPEGGDNWGMSRREMHRTNSGHWRPPVDQGQQENETKPEVHLSGHSAPATSQDQHQEGKVSTHSYPQSTTSHEHPPTSLQPLQSHQHIPHSAGDSSGKWALEPGQGDFGGQDRQSIVHHTVVSALPQSVGSCHGQRSSTSGSLHLPGINMLSGAAQGPEGAMLRNCELPRVKSAAEMQHWDNGKGEGVSSERNRGAEGDHSIRCKDGGTELVCTKEEDLEIHQDSTNASQKLKLFGSFVC